LPADWTVDDARAALRDPSTPAYVAQKIREWLFDRERERAAKSEPVPRAGRRVVNLGDVMALAVAVGMDLDGLVAAAKAKAPQVESGYPSLHREPPEVPPVLSVPGETDLVVDVVGGFFKEPDDRFVAESDGALAESIAAAEEERELGRIRAELGLDVDEGGEAA
jgi:hypothetical protein